MAFNYKTLEKQLRERFAEEVLGWTVFREQHVLQVRRAEIVEILRFLRDDPAAGFEMLTDLTCIDHLKWPDDMAASAPERFAVVYQLTSLKSNARLRVKAFVSEEHCEIDSVTSLWKAAEWSEREAFDMFGIDFIGHPDLRRILMPDDYEGFPLRKDYPLKGRGERDNFPKFSETVVEQ